MQVVNSMDKHDNDSSAVVKRLSVPLGLEELMESLTKQVLQKKPRDIYSFASDHFAKLLELRDKSSGKNVQDSSLSTPPKAITLSDAQANILSYKSAIFATAPTRLRVRTKQTKAIHHEVRDETGLDPKIRGGTLQDLQSRQRCLAAPFVPITPPALGGHAALLRRQQQGAIDHQQHKQRQQGGRKAPVARAIVEERRQKGWNERSQLDETSVQAPIRRSSTERRKQYDKERHNVRLKRTQIHSSEESIAKSDNSDSMNHIKQLPTNMPNNSRKSRVKPSRGATIKQTESFEVLDEDIFIDGNNITLKKNDTSKRVKIKAAQLVAGAAAVAVPNLILNQSEDSENTELDNDEKKRQTLSDDSDSAKENTAHSESKNAYVEENSSTNSTEDIGDIFVDKIDPSFIDKFDNALSESKVTSNNTTTEIIEDENKIIEQIAETITSDVEKVGENIENNADRANGIQEGIETTNMVIDNTDKKIETMLNDIAETINTSGENEIKNIVMDKDLMNIKATLDDNAEDSLKEGELDNTNLKEFIQNEPAFAIIDVSSGELDENMKIDDVLISNISNEDRIGIDDIDRATKNCQLEHETTIDDESHSSKKITPYLKDTANTPAALLTPDQISPRNENNESNVALVTASVVNSAKTIISGSLAALDDEIAKILLEYNEKQSTHFFLNKEVENYKSEKSDVEYTYIPLRDYSIENDGSSKASDGHLNQDSLISHEGTKDNKNTKDIEDLIVKEDVNEAVYNTDDKKDSESMESNEERIEINFLQSNEEEKNDKNETLNAEIDNIIETGISKATDKIDIPLDNLKVVNLAQDIFFGKEVSPRTAHEECLVTKSNRAATQIQSAWRGHKTRKILACRQLQMTEEYNEFPEYRLDAEDALRAATTIQAFLRGHLVRKALRQSNASVIDSPEKCHILEEILEEPEVEIMAETNQNKVKFTDEEVQEALMELDGVKVPKGVVEGTKSPKLKRSFTIENQKTAEKDGNKRSGGFCDNERGPEDVDDLKNEIHFVTDPDILNNEGATVEVVKDVLVATDAMKETNGTAVEKQLIAIPIEINDASNHNLLSLESPFKDENTLHYEMAPTRPLTSENTETIVAKLDSQLLRKSLEIVDSTAEEEEEEVGDDLKLQIKDVASEDIIESVVDISGKESELSNRSFEEDVSMESQESGNTVIMVKDLSARLTPESDAGNTLDEIDDSVKDMLHNNMGISPLPMDLNEKLSRYNDLNIRHDVENSEFIEEMSSLNIDSELQQNLRNSLDHENNNAIIIENENNGDLSEEQNIKILTDIISAAIKIQSLYRGYKVRAKTYTKPNGKANIGIVIEGPENNNNAELENKNKVYDDVIAKIEEEQCQELENFSGSLEDSSINKQSSVDGSKHQAAEIIQKHYKGYRVRRDLADQATKDVDKELICTVTEIDQENAAATTIQKNYKAVKARRKLMEQSKKISDTKMLESSQDEVADGNDLKNYEEENAALTIQKHYRGFKSRQNLIETPIKDIDEKKMELNEEITKNSKDDVNNTSRDDEEERAALSIQKYYKDYKFKKELCAKNEVIQPEKDEIEKKFNNTEIIKANFTSGSGDLEKSNGTVDSVENKSNNPSIQEFIDSIIEANVTDIPIQHPIIAQLKNTERFIETSIPQADSIFSKRDDQESTVVIEEILEDADNDDKLENGNDTTLILEHELVEILDKNQQDLVLEKEDLDKQMQSEEDVMENNSEVYFDTQPVSLKENTNSTTGNESNYDTILVNNTETNTSEGGNDDSALKSSEDIIKDESEVFDNNEDTKTKTDQGFSEPVSDDDHAKIKRMFTVAEDEIIKEDVYMLGQKDEENANFINGKHSEDIKKYEMQIEQVESDNRSKEILVEGLEAFDNIIEEGDNLKNGSSQVEGTTKEENDSESINKLVNNVKKLFNLADLHKEILEAGAISNNEETDVIKSTKEQNIKRALEEPQIKKNTDMEILSNNNKLIDLKDKDIKHDEDGINKSTLEIIQGIEDEDQVNNDMHYKDNVSFVGNAAEEEKVGNEYEVVGKTVADIKGNIESSKAIKHENEDVSVGNLGVEKSVSVGDSCKEFNVNVGEVENVDLLQTNENRVPADNDKTQVNTKEETDAPQKLPEIAHEETALQSEIQTSGIIKGVVIKANHFAVDSKSYNEEENVYKLKKVALNEEDRNNKINTSVQECEDYGNANNDESDSVLEEVLADQSIDSSKLQEIANQEPVIGHLSGNSYVPPNKNEDDPLTSFIHEPENDVLKDKQENKEMESIKEESNVFQQPNLGIVIEAEEATTEMMSTNADEQSANVESSQSTALEEVPLENESQEDAREEMNCNGNMEIVASVSAINETQDLIESNINEKEDHEAQTQLSVIDDNNIAINGSVKECKSEENFDIASKDSKLEIEYLQDDNMASTNNDDKDSEKIFLGIDEIKLIDDSKRELINPENSIIFEDTTIISKEEFETPIEKDVCEDNNLPKDETDNDSKNNDVQQKKSKNTQVADEIIEDENSSSQLKDTAYNTDSATVRDVLEKSNQTQTDDAEKEEVTNVESNKKEASRIVANEEQLKFDLAVVVPVEDVKVVNADMEGTFNESKHRQQAIDVNNKSGLKLEENEIHLDSITTISKSKGKLTVETASNNITGYSNKEVRNNEKNNDITIESESNKGTDLLDKSMDTSDEDENNKSNLEASNEPESKLEAAQENFKSAKINVEQSEKPFLDHSDAVEKNLNDNESSHETKVELNDKIIKSDDVDVIKGQELLNIEDTFLINTTIKNNNTGASVEVTNKPETKIETNEESLISEMPMNIIAATEKEIDDEITSTPQTFSAEQQETFAQLKCKSEEIESQLRNSLKKIEAFNNEQLQEPFYLHDPNDSTTHVIQNNPIARVVQIAAGTTHTTAANIELLQTAASSKAKVREATLGKPLCVNVDSSGDVRSPILGVINPQDIKDGHLPVTLQLCQDASGDADGPPGSAMEQKKRNNAQSGNTVRGAKQQNPEAIAATKIQAGFRGYKVRKEMKDKNALDITSPKRRGNRRRASGKIVDSNRNTVPVVTTTVTDGIISDLEEKSATKIQAGVRGFLVRRRNHNQKNRKN